MIETLQFVFLPQHSNLVKLNFLEVYRLGCFDMHSRELVWGGASDFACFQYTLMGPRREKGKIYCVLQQKWQTHLRGYFVSCSVDAFTKQILTNFIQNDSFIAGLHGGQGRPWGVTNIFAQSMLSQSFLRRESLWRREAAWKSKTHLMVEFWGVSGFMLLEVHELMWIVKISIAYTVLPVRG